jgi:multidrug efflux pump subunit AcrB
MSIMKTGSASTLDIIKGVHEKIAEVTGQLPPQLKIKALSDQSIFVKSAINGVVREAIIAACLTAIMILVFLGSWRSTIIIAVSIPLSILCSLSVLYMLHETINIMTLGGMALAVGILVDDATVAIENINRNLEEGKELEQSILDGSAQIAVPALVSTLSICIVFVPMFFLNGVARFLFVPMAEAVVFAMLASYVLSRTLVRADSAQAGQPQSIHALPAGIRGGLRGIQKRLSAPADAMRRPRQGVSDCFHRVRHRVGRRADSMAWPGLFSCGGFGPVQDSRARAYGNPH